MKNFISLLIICMGLVYPEKASTQVTLEETTLDTTTLITGLNIPWEIKYGPDDWLWVTERHGRVSRIHPETGEQLVILDHTDVVHQQGESGMLGMVLHPDFDEVPRVYLVYTYQSGGIKERLVYFDYQDNSLVNETVLLEGIPGNSTHDGSRLVITPDQKILMTTGDAQDQAAAQDINSLNGKILRLNLDGTIPADNPFGSDNYTYTFGHRNAQGLDYGYNGILYSSEHGPSTDDEVNIIEEGRNYGWPEVLGFCDTPAEQDFCEEHDVKEPMIAWTPTIAPSDIIYYDSDAIPEWEHTILLTVLKDKRVVELELSPDGKEITAEKQWFVSYWGRLRDICTGTDGELYLATNGDSWSNNDPFTHSIIKLVPQATSSGNLDEGGKSMIKVINDSAGAIRVDFDEALSGRSYFVYNTSGQQVEKGRINPQDGMQHLNGFQAGIYLIHVPVSGHEVASRKFIVR